MQDALSRYLARTGLDSKLRNAKVIRAWDQTLGPMAVHARAVKFQRGELVVEVDSAAHFAELSSFTGEAYRRATNQRLGRETIERVTFQKKR
jgi:hypothetical protein